VLDDFSDSTESAYTGWPDRLYVIGSDGTIAYKSPPGPYGFSPAEVDGVLIRLLGHSQSLHPYPIQNPLR
jgi:hypothetical protein